MNFKHQIVRSVGKILLLFAFVLSIGTYSMAIQKHGLLIGISTYPTETGWGKTHASNDVKVVNKSLQNEGFHDVHILLNERATKQDVLNKLESILLELQQGDVFLFYFSGHGQLIKDYNADEFDGYDESLVLYGAPKEYDELYKNENHLLDDELSEIMNRFRLKLGAKGELIVLTETGYGWTPESTEAFARGGAKPLTDNNIRPDMFTNLSSETGILDDLPYGKPSDSYSRLIQIAAVAVNNQALEYAGNGIFTLALTRAFESKNDSSTYLEFVRMVETNTSAMNSKQKPGIEGDLERIMFESFLEERRTNYDLAQKLIQTDISEEEVQFMLQLKADEEPKIKNQVGLTDWEKSFFRP